MAGGVRVRMYRTGFGDCFLLSFGASGSAGHVLVDFGAHLTGEIGTMDEVMADIEATTGKSLDLVVATHFHRDHVSGFGEFAERFAAFDRIGAVWMPWTDDPTDPRAAALQRKQLALYERLERHLRATGAGGPQAEAALAALANLRGNEKARAALRGGFGLVRPAYLAASARRRRVPGIAGLTAQVLGPPSDETFLARMDPPASQRYLAAPGEPGNAVRPFPDWELRPTDPDFAEIAHVQPQVPARELAALHQAAEAPAEGLALTLDNVRNNTSLVLVFRYRGKTLLFPGDAQWGSWQSWIGTDEATELLGQVDFLKLAHHGSHNATPRDVVDALRASGLAAMVSTQAEPFPTIPRQPLLEAVSGHCIEELVVRSDWVTVRGAPRGPGRPRRFPATFVPGKLWIDCVL